MSDGPSDCRAEGELYRAVWRACYDIRQGLIGPRATRQFPCSAVDCINELLADLGWCFAPGRRFSGPCLDPIDFDPVVLWDAVQNLRRALRRQMVGHRGWSPVIDPEVDYALTGTGYELVQFKEVWLSDERE